MDSVKSRPRKHYLPLESNPEVFTDLIRKLGVQSLEFQDVYSLDDEGLLAMVSRPVLSLVLVFPTTDTYKNKKAEEEATIADYSGSGEEEPVVWFRQTINNACGLYGILHAVSNGTARELLGEFVAFLIDGYISA